MSSIKIPRKLIIGYSLFVPIFAFAQQPEAINNLVTQVQNTINLVAGFMVLIATVVFIYGVIQYILSAGDDKTRQAAQGRITWGIVGLAVIAGAWGVANVLVRYFIGSSGAAPSIIKQPTF